MIDALIYLTAAVICVPVAKRLGLGAVLGYLIAGMLIGPWGLRLIGDIEASLRFAEFGVVLMLFVIGLELEPKRLIAMRQSVFGGGTLQVVFCGAALAAGTMLFGVGWKAALVVGTALALSSTAIAVATMSERNFLSAPTGQASFATLLFQDIAAIPLLAIVPLLGAGLPGSSDPAYPVWLAAAKAFAAIATVIVIGVYCTRPLLRVIAATELREVFTAFALLLVIGISQLMLLAGLSMGLGAFLAGVLLASSEYRHALESDIEPFKGLLLGLFFISVGMTVDFGLLLAKPGMVALLLLSFLLVKILTLLAVARIIGISDRQRWLFAILLSQGGEFAFVVFGASRVAGLISREWEGLLTMAVALSMATTPLLLIVHDWWEARRECGAAGTRDAADTIDEKDAAVIIAGFGRFGQIVGRLLMANGVRTVVLDHDPDQIELLRKYGNKVFYGDATRLDLLRAAGAGEAKLIINAIDDVDDNLKLTDLAQRHFPQTQIIARARNATHYIALRKRGVALVERETFESALLVGRHALEKIGVDRFRARDMANAFRRHNISITEAMIPHFDDEERMVSATKAGRDALAQQFAKDRQRFELEHTGQGWKQDAADAMDDAE